MVTIGRELAGFRAQSLCRWELSGNVRLLWTFGRYQLTCVAKYGIIFPEYRNDFRNPEKPRSVLSMVNDKNLVQAVSRAFLILDLLRDSKEGMRLGEIAAAAGLNTTTTHRLLRTLMGCKVVQQDARTRLYSLSPYILVYGRAVLNRFDFIRRAHPLLGELSKAVGETVFMGILDGFDLVYVDHVDSLDHVLRLTPQIGRRHTSHTTALGKVLLAHLDPDTLETFLSNTKLPKLTENTITDPGALRKELEAIRRKGYAMDREETETGICCVAAPVRQGDGRVVAAISISGPSPRLKKKGLETFLREQVQATAAKVSQLLCDHSFGCG